MWLHLMLALASVLLGAAEPELPAGAQRALNTYNTAEAAARVALVKALETEQAKATKANKLDEALAIRELIKKAQDGDVLPKIDSDLLGDGTKSVFVGRYENAVDGKLNMELKADGTAYSFYHRTAGAWTIENGSVTLRWSGRSLLEIIRAPDKNGVYAGENQAGDKWTQRKETKK